MHFATCFPEAQPWHLPKDVGLLPEILAREHGYRTTLLSQRELPAAALAEHIPHVKHVRLPRFRSLQFLAASARAASDYVGVRVELVHELAAVRSYFRKHAADIDVLQLYHPNLRSGWIARLYREARPDGVLHLKLDVDPDKYGSLIKAGLPDDRVAKVLRAAEVDVVTAETAAVVDAMRAHRPVFLDESAQIMHLPNGIDGRKLTAEVDLPRQNIFLHVGRLGSSQKRSDLVLEAFAAVASEFPDWTLVLAGPSTPSFEEHVHRSLAARPKLREQVRLLGRVEPRAELLAWYRRASALVVPSDHEGFPLVAVEAMARGCPIIGTDIGALRELTEEGSCGALVPRGDAHALSEALRGVAAHPARLRQWSERVRALVRERYDWTRALVPLDSALRVAASRRARN